jgi:hypothetical protein
LAIIRLHTQRLDTRQFFPRTYLDEKGEVQPLLRLRLVTYPLLGPDPAEGEKDQRGPELPALVDTGATVSTFPRHVWEQFEPQITRFRLNPAEVAARPPDQRVPRSTALGRAFDYFLGGIWVAAIDLEGRRMPAIRVVAQFREDRIPENERQPPILLGVSLGILEGRRLVRTPTLGAEDGQEWWLSDF